MQGHELLGEPVWPSPHSAKPLVSDAYSALIMLPSFVSTTPAVAAAVSLVRFRGEKFGLNFWQLSLLQMSYNVDSGFATRYAP